MWGDTFFNYFVWGVIVMEDILSRWIFVFVWFTIRYFCSRHYVVPECPQVPTKETPFDASFFANTNVGNNCYPAASDIICGVSQTEKISSLYVRHNTGKVGSCCVLALYGAKFVLKCMWSYVPARLCSLTRPVSLYKELFSRFGSSWALSWVT